MQFSTLALAALSIGSAFATSSSSSSSSSTTKSTSTKSGSTKTSSASSAATATGASVAVHVVTVSSSKNNTLTYSPSNLQAAVGDMVQFQFGVGNHTITQSNFDNPCEPISLHSNLTALYSGFMPVAATAVTTPTYTIMINSTTPIWLYCSQAKHCQGGMVMVINENTAANATRSLTNYKAGAKLAANNLFPGQVVTSVSAGGATTSAASGLVTATAVATGTATLSQSTTATGTGAARVTNSSAAGSVRTGQAIGGSALLAVLAFFL